MTLQRAHSIGIFLSVLTAGASAGCTVEAPGTEPIIPPGSTSSSGGSAGAASPSGGSAGTAPITGTAGSTSAQAGSGGTISAGGSGGATSTAGASGSSTTAGAGGSGSGGRPSGPSAGCQTPVQNEEPGVAVQHDLMVTVAEKYRPTYEPRKYYTSLPQPFDPAKPYPMVFYGQGCGQTTAESGPFNKGHFVGEVLYVQLIPAAVTAQTVVPPKGAPGCFQAGKQGLADSPDGPYFDQVLAEIEQRYCVDRGKAYVAGWSSGAWLSNYLACARGNVIAGTAAGSGGLHHDHGTCTGGAPVMLLPGDAGSINEDGFDIGAAAARDLFVTTNGCSATPTDVKLGNQTCQVHGGCANPVAWCPQGGGHGGPLEFIAESGWAFWTTPR